MKEYKIRSASLKKQLRIAIAIHESMKGSYFWTPPSSASGRRQMEKQKSFEMTFVFQGVEYSISISTDVSCRNVYYDCKILKDGKKSNIRSIKALIA